MVLYVREASESRQDDDHTHTPTVQNFEIVKDHPQIASEKFVSWICSKTMDGSFLNKTRFIKSEVTKPRQLSRTIEYTGVPFCRSPKAEHF
ncbi:hypothetical protein AFLA_003403 [Aspergillus flavus NRRL3357]|nr:hypothetical protein AFLA_003403 [Aspergillus flavus NRRL3357]